jgi:hypothetical protein
MSNTPAGVLLIALASAALAGCSSTSLPTAPNVPPPPVTETAPPAPPPPAAPATARYRVVFDSTWSASTHPTDFPGTAHYSGLIGGTHAARTAFWVDGALASDGIRQMAERGRKTPLDTEVQAAIASGDAEHILSGPELDVSPGVVSMEFEISQSFRLVTLVTMIAPSPDWFVGVSGLPLFESGQWRDEVRVELPGWDAGTDSGATYRASDRETIPRAPISRLTGYPVESAGEVRPFGTFTFTRIP